LGDEESQGPSHIVHIVAKDRGDNYDGRFRVQTPCVYEFTAVIQPSNQFTTASNQYSLDTRYELESCTTDDIAINVASFLGSNPLLSRRG